MQVWHAIGRHRKPLRKQYIELIVPPFVAILRRWRPLLAGIHELTSSDGQNPLIADDRAVAVDALPVEVLCGMIYVIVVSEKYGYIFLNSPMSFIACLERKHLTGINLLLVSLCLANIAEFVSSSYFSSPNL
jgi:hypothetical protein